MAIVYKARCTLLNRIVAVKVLRQQFSIDDDFVRRFRREAQAAASLSHPNIVSIYDVGQDKETYFIVMEYVEGETLKDLIEREAPLAPSRAVNVIRQIANALYHAHNNKIIHRDIKPHNVLLSKDGRVKVADFGIARAVTSTTQTFSPNSIMGSVHYFSPEQAKGKLATEQSDLYSLGIVLYEMLTKKLPFDGESPISIALKHLQQTIPPVAEHNSEMTPELQGILDKMLEKDRSLRYQSATDLLAALRTWNVAATSGEGAADHHDELDSHSQTQVYGPVKSDEDDAKKRWQKKLILWGTIGLVFGAAIYFSVVGLTALQNMWTVDEVEIPNVYGMDLADAIEALDAQGLTNYEVVGHVFHDTIPENHVTTQRPAADRVVKQNRVIELTLSKGPDLVEVPPLEGLDRREAEATLQGLGLQPSVELEYSESHAFGVVIRQEPLTGKIARSQMVRLVVSQGAHPIQMENLVGRTYQQASTIIQELMLEERIVRWETPRGDSPDGIVTRQSITANEDVQPETPVDLWLRPFNRISQPIEITGLNPGSSYVIRIVVTDITGESTEESFIVSGQDSYSQTVTGWERGTIVIYLDGSRYEEIDF